MNRISKSLIVICLIMFSVIFYLQTCYQYSYNPFVKNQNIILNKPKDIDNQEFVETINRISKETNVFPLYLEQDITDGNYNTNTYYTNYQGSLPDKYPELYNQSNKESFLKMTKFSLEQIQVALLSDSQSEVDFIKALEEAGIDYQYAEFNQEAFLIGSNYLLILMVIITCLVTITIYVMQEKKRYAILKMEGYKAKEIIRIEFLKFKKLIYVTTIIYSLILIILLVKNDVNFVGLYVENNLISITFLLTIILFNLLLSYQVYENVSIYKIKNNIVSGKPSNLIVLFSIVLMIMMINNISVLIDTTNDYIQEIANYKKIQGVYEYSYIPVYSDISDYEAEESSELDKVLLNFYFATVNDLNGVLINKNVGEEYQKVTINQNYLKFSEIIDSQGQLIDVSNYKQSYLNLVPISEKQIIDEASLDNVVLIKDDQKLFNIDVRTGKQGEITDYQYITLILADNLADFGNIDEELIANEIVVPMSSGNYYVKTNKDDPNAITKKYIEDVNADNYIRETPLIGNELLKNIIELKYKLLNYIVMSMINIILTLIIIKYSIQIFIINRKKKLSVYTLETGKQEKSFKKYVYIVNIVIASWGIVASIILRQPIVLLITIISVSCLIIYQLSSYRQLITSNLANNIKGEL